MNRRILPLFLILLVWFVVGFFLCKKYLCNSTPSQTISQSSIAPVTSETSAWTVADNDFNTTSPDYFGFQHSGATHMDLSAGLGSSVAAIAAYLQSNSNRSMDITGYYMDNETNNSIMPSLGMARANDIKQLFVNAGVPTNQLNLKDAVLPDASWADATTVKRGIALDFSAMATADTRLEEIRARLVGNPMTLYFRTNKDNVSLSSDQRKVISDIIYYLDRVPESSLDISGHTDNRGGRRLNAKLSEGRAQFVLDYLAKNGMTGDRMTSKGYGPDQPIASNDDEAGRAKNRRVEVVLK